MKGRVLSPGRASGPLLRLTAPLSFWGGIDPATGLVIAGGHPQHGLCVAGQVLAMPVTIGSSSSSSVLLELIRSRKAPAALILGSADAILLVGCLVARELGWIAPPVIELAPDAIDALAPGDYLLAEDGALRFREPEGHAIHGRP